MIFVPALRRSRSFCLLSLLLSVSTVLFMSTSWSIKFRVGKLYENVQLQFKAQQATWRNRQFCDYSKTANTTNKPVISINKLVTPKFLPNFRNPCWISEPGNTTLCLPYFYIAGFPKSGTTDLHKRVSSHPVIVYSPIKEPHYITRQLFKDDCSKKNLQNAISDCYVTEYARLFFKRSVRAIVSNVTPRHPLHEAFIGETEKINQQVDHTIDHPLITFDCSASTAWDANQWELIEENQGCSEPAFLPADIIVKMNPDVLIIMIMREPVQRAYSDYLNFNEDTSPEDFHHRVSLFLTFYEACLKTHSIRHCVYDVKNHENFLSRARLEVGLYHVYIRDWLDRLPRDRFLFLRLEDYTKNIISTIQGVFQFLQIPQLSQDAMEKIRQIPRANVDKQKHLRKPMLPETQQLLTKFYDAYNCQLAKLLGDERFTWRDVIKSTRLHPIDM